MNPELWDAIAKVERRHWWFVGRREIVARALEERLPYGGQILDIGCGTGFVLERLAASFEVTGLEPDEAVRLRANDSIRDRILPGATHDLSALGTATFDALTLLDVLEHVDDDAGVLRTARELLSPDGVLLVTVPANPRLWSEHDVLNGHRRRYTADLLRDLISSTGFEIERLTHINSRLYPLAWLYRLNRGKSGFALRLPPAPVNRLFASLFMGEWHGTRRGGRRGLSLMAVARRAG